MIQHRGGVSTAARPGIKIFNIGDRECYRRVKSDIDPSILFYEWRSGRLDAISVTSVEGLRNLVDILGEQGNQKLKATPLFVPHQRIAGEAAKLGIAEVIVTGSGDETMLVAMITRFSSKN